MVSQDQADEYTPISTNLEHGEADVELEDVGRYVPSVLKHWAATPFLLLLTSRREMIPLHQRQWMVLAVVCFLGTGTQFDSEIFNMSLFQIQQSLNISERQVGILASLMRVGNLLAIFGGPIADQCGRRITILVSVLLYSMFSFASAFSSTMGMFAVLQIGSRALLMVQYSTSFTLVLEELDESTRGWGVGLVSSMSAIGAGLALLLNGIVGNYSWGWRLLFGLSILQVPFLFFANKYLPESQKFVENVAQEQVKEMDVDSYNNTFRGLFVLYPKRLACCTIVVTAAGFSLAVADVFKIKYLEQELGVTPGQISMVFVGLGSIGVWVCALAGRMSDRYGRKSFLVGAYTGLPLTIMGFYNSSGWTWLLFLFIQVVGGFVLAAVATSFFGEIFPTRYRTSAQLYLIFCSYVGQIVSIGLETVLYERFENHSTAITILAVPALLLCAPIVYFYLPETANRPLEELNSSTRSTSHDNVELVDRTVL